MAKSDRNRPERPKDAAGPGRRNVLGPTDKVLVRLPTDMHARLKAHMEETGRSVNDSIRLAIEEWLARTEREREEHKLRKQRRERK